jgi:hypothetical protein
VADVEGPWNEDQVAMADAVQQHEIQNGMLLWTLELQLTLNVSASPEDVVQESHVEDFQATSPVACHVQVLTVLCYKQQNVTLKEDSKIKKLSECTGFLPVLYFDVADDLVIL